MAYYQNSLFGFSLAYPAGWEVRETGSVAPIAEATPPGQTSPTLSVFVDYAAEVLSPAKAADRLIAQLLTVPGAKVLSQREVNVTGGAAYEVVYSFGRGEQEGRGVLLVVSRGSQLLTLILIAPRAAYEAKAQEYLAVLSQFRLEEPRPFGISRREALTLVFPEPLTLDPALVTEVRSVQYITQIFGGLVALSPTLEVVPDLAESWEVSAQGTVYIFRLRPNARFHSGRPVTAQDVKYSWERAARSESTTILTYLGDIEGVKEVVEKKARDIRGVEVVGERTLRVTIDAPKAYFLAKLTHPAAYVVDRSNVEQGEDWWRKPNGTGPFRLKGWQSGLALALEANKEYHRAPSQLSYVVFRHLGGSPLKMYETDEVDVAFPSLEELEEMTASGSPLVRELQEQAQLSISYIGFNAAQPPFDDPKVRRAFLLATDRERLLKEVLRGKATVAHGFLPPGLPGHNPQLAPISYNPEEARRLLAQSSYGKDLPPLTFTAAGFAAPSPLVEALIQMWRENLGVRVEVRLIEPSQYYYGLETRLDNFYEYGWIADYPDPQNFLDVLFHSQSVNNVGKYKREEVDRLLEKARVEADPKTRFQLYQEVEEALRAEAAAIPLNFGREFYFTKPRVKGFVVSPQGLAELRLVSLAP